MGTGYSGHLEPDGPRRQVVEGGQFHTDEVPEERQYTVDMENIVEDL